jgi:predicted nucleic acid-binding protein
MFLVDTSVCVDHFRKGQSELVDRLSNGLVLMHPSVSGELACGNLKDRAAVLADLSALPLVQVATDAEVLHLIEQRKLWGGGLGWLDVHLQASALLSRCQFWTFDKALERAASDLGLL